MSSKPMQGAIAYDQERLLQNFPCPLIATNLQGAYAIPAIPRDFDPITASDAELTKHGLLWKRPTEKGNPALARAWERVFSRERVAKSYIVPQLEPQVGKTHNLRRPLRQVADQNFVNSAWAGAGIRGLGPWNGALGIWHVPTVSKPSEPQGLEGGWNSSSWVGIDGFDAGGTISNDVLQAGIEQKVDANGNPSYVAWYEWFAPPQPGSPQYIYQTNFSNFAVTAGQQILCLVNYFNVLPYLPPMGVLLLANETTGQSVLQILFAPPGATATGNTVEWIMEAPDGGEPQSSLPKFTPVVFTSAVASGALGEDAGNPEFGDTANIETAGAKLLTSVTVGNETVTIDFIG